MGKYIRILVFIATLFTTAKTQEQPTCPSAHEWIKEMTHTDTYYSAMRKEILQFVTIMK